MLKTSPNFSFLETGEQRLARLATLAERYFVDDPAGALVKLRSFAESMAKEIAARNAVLPPASPTFDQVLSALRARGLLPREAADLFYHLKRIGNSAAHEDAGSSQQALAALKFAHALAVWFHRGYGGAPNFTGGPFVPPRPPVDASAELRAELDELRALVHASRDAEAKARVAASEAEVARAAALELAGEREQERAFWQDYAAETEAGQRAAEGGSGASAFERQAGLSGRSRFLLPDRPRILGQHRHERLHGRIGAPAFRPQRMQRRPLDRMGCQHRHQLAARERAGGGEAGDHADAAAGDHCGHHCIACIHDDCRGRSDLDLAPAYGLNGSGGATMKYVYSTEASSVPGLIAIEEAGIACELVETSKSAISLA